MPPDPSPTPETSSSAAIPPAGAKPTRRPRVATSRQRAPRVPASAPKPIPRTQSESAGLAQRDKVPRKSHALWNPSASRPDPIALLEQSNRDRLPELVPIRYGRMLASPFTFLRGSAGVMAADLATLPNTGFQVQACGDCHVMNFGLFATPERNLVFDLNDFDETLPAPWEFDIKRLAASCIAAARDNGRSDAQGRDAVEELARSYREHMRECATLSPLDVWYKRLDMEELIEKAPDTKARELREQLARQARARIIEHLFPKISTEKDGRYVLVDQPPVLFHPQAENIEERARAGLADYRVTLSDERQRLLDRYELKDIVLKVVGIGSVGTRCMVALLVSPEGHPLLLQIKEALHSVLEPYIRRSRYDNQGQRVVMGQRLMQSSSDIFLGWARGRYGKDFYVRQLRDMKMTIPMEGLTGPQLCRYANACGWTLARAHAKSGDPAAISGYLGNGDNFDRALAKFAVAYADQTEKDHAALVSAVRSGRVHALREE